MSNSSEFLDYYNKIDTFIKKHDKFDQTSSFTFRVKNSKNKIVKRFKDDLISLGELRNAIVHNPKIGEKTIAEPHDETVQLIKELYKKVSNPKKVYPEFSFPVLGAKEKDFINHILLEMKEKSFSQFPVYDENEHVIELINTNTISRYISSQLEENGTLIIEYVKVSDLIPEIEFKKNYKFVSRETSIYEAFDLFIEQITIKKRNLDVLFITGSGKQTEKLLGLITIEDIADKV